MRLKKKIVIFGAGSGGKEILNLIRECNQRKDQYEIIGFVDEKIYKRNLKINNIPVIKLRDLKKQETIYGVSGVLDSVLREKIYNNEIKKNGVLTLSIIHPSVIVPDDTSIGKGCIIYSNTHISYNIKLGKGVIIAFNCDLGHDLKVGNYSSLMPGTIVNGNCKIGKKSLKILKSKFKPLFENFLNVINFLIKK